MREELPPKHRPDQDWGRARSYGLKRHDPTPEERKKKKRERERERERESKRGRKIVRERKRQRVRKSEKEWVREMEKERWQGEREIETERYREKQKMKMSEEWRRIHTPIMLTIRSVTLSLSHAHTLPSTFFSLTHYDSLQLCHIKL